MFKNIIFDFDGTLFDTKEDVFFCLFESYRINGVEVPTGKKLKIGPPLRAMVDLLTPELNEDAKVSIISSFKTLYDNSDYPLTMPYPQVVSVLTDLKSAQLRLYVASNKRSAPIKRILGKYSVSVFEGMVTPDTCNVGIAGKAGMVGQVVKDYLLCCDETMLIGDSPEDINAAKINSVKSVGVEYGYSGINEMIDSKPDYLIKNIVELKKLVLE